MKILQTALSHLALLGIRSNKSLINVNFLLTELIIWKTVLQSLLFLILEAQNFREYTNAFFLISTNAMAAACFTILAANGGSIFTIVDILEKIVQSM